MKSRKQETNYSSSQRQNIHMLYYQIRAISCSQNWNLICETKKDINVKTETDSHCQHKHYLFRFTILSDPKTFSCIRSWIWLIFKEFFSMKNYMIPCKVLRYFVSKIIKSNYRILFSSSTSSDNYVTCVEIFYDKFQSCSHLQYYIGVIEILLNILGSQYAVYKRIIEWKLKI